MYDNIIRLMDRDPKEILDYFQVDKEPREAQIEILLLVAKAIREGFKNIIIEAPTGVGKSAIAYTLLRFLKGGYIATSTKSLQEQYHDEYPEFYQIMGKPAFPCNFKAEQKIMGVFECGICEDFGNTDPDKCFHKFASMAPCVTEPEFKEVIKLPPKRKFRDYGEVWNDGEEYDDEERTVTKICCPYYVENEDYVSHQVEDTVNNRGLIQEISLLPGKLNEMIEDRYHNPKLGLDLQENLSDEMKQKIADAVEECHYFGQLRKGMLADHSILNYSNYIVFSHMQRLPQRNVTIFDEAHDIEDQIIKFTELSFKIDDVKKILYEVGEDPESVEIPDSFDIMLHIPFMEKMHSFLDSLSNIKAKDDHERKVKKEAIDERDRIKRTLDFIKLDVNNWKVIELKRNKYTNVIEKAVYKPINLSKFCQMIYRNSEYNIFMSASILDRDMYCANQGLDPALTAYVSVPSDFPVGNRPIYMMDIEALNYDNMKKPEVQQKIIRAIDELMDKHSDVKGIIHTTSYAQLDFIRYNISKKNHARLIQTQPNGQGEEATAKVVEAHKKDPRHTVLISPSLNTGVDLKYKASEFQIIVKVPYPDRSDLWIEAKRQDNVNWYIYKTALKLVQAYGRSIRAKDDKAVTYILDSNFHKNLMRDIKAVRILPRWFKDAIVYK